MPDNSRELLAFVFSILVELDAKGELKIVVLETLIVRREQEGNSKMNSSLQTSLLVENGDIIEAKTPVAKTEVLAINDGVASVKGDISLNIKILF